MVKQPKTWARNSRGPSKQETPDFFKAGICAKAQMLIDGRLKPAHIKPPRKKPDFNLLVDLQTMARQDVAQPDGMCSLCLLCPSVIFRFAPFQ